MNIRRAAIGLILSLLSMATLAQTSREPLATYHAGEPVLRLQGKQADASLAIPLAAGQRVTAATLQLDVVSSRALVKPRSILNVRFNNATVGQIMFDPDRPHLRSSVELPARLWRAGFNELTFAVSQHYANQCVESSAPELWSELDLSQSTLAVTTEPGEQLAGLQSLSGYFSPGIGSQAQVTLVSVDEQDATLYSQALPLVAQALALRNQYKPLSINHQAINPLAELPQIVTQSEQVEALVDRYQRSSWYLAKDETAGTPDPAETPRRALHVLIGTKDKLAPLLDAATREQINGPFLTVQATPAVQVQDTVVVHQYQRLVVSGRTAAEVRTAALTLGLMDDALNPDASLVVAGQTSPTAAFLAADIAQPGEDYSFAQLGQSHILLRGEDAFSKDVNLTLPADFYVPENASVRLNLDFGYGAALGAGSMMNLLINDELVHGLTLSNPGGQAFRDYQLVIPARHFQGGVNTLTFDVTLRAPITGQQCDEIGGSHLMFQVRNTSSIELPEAGQVASQPDLALFRDTGFPFATQSEEPVAIYLTDPAMTGAALTLAGKLAQTAGTMLASVQIVNTLSPQVTANAVVLATPDTLPAELSADYATSLAATKRWPYRLQNDLHNRIREAVDDKGHTPLQMRGTTEQVSGLDTMAVLIAQQNPRSQETGNMYIIAAQTPALLSARINDLVSLSLWGQLAGDFFSWRDARQPLMAMQVAETFELGEPASGWLRLRLWMSNNPWYWLIAVAVVVLLSAWLAMVLLKRRNKAVTEQW